MVFSMLDIDEAKRLYRENKLFSVIAIRYPKNLKIWLLKVVYKDGREQLLQTGGGKQTKTYLSYQSSVTDAIKIGFDEVKINFKN